MVGDNAFKSQILEDSLTEEQEKAIEWKGKGFDFRTHIRCPREAKILKHQPYKMVIDKSDGIYLLRDGQRFSTSGVRLDQNKGK